MGEKLTGIISEVVWAQPLPSARQTAWCNSSLRLDERKQKPPACSKHFERVLYCKSLIPRDNFVLACYLLESTVSLSSMPLPKPSTCAWSHPRKNSANPRLTLGRNPLHHSCMIYRQQTNIFFTATKKKQVADFLLRAYLSCFLCLLDWEPVGEHILRVVYVPWVPACHAWAW